CGACAEWGARRRAPPHTSGLLGGGSGARQGVGSGTEACVTAAPPSERGRATEPDRSAREEAPMRSRIVGTAAILFCGVVGGCNRTAQESAPAPVPVVSDAKHGNAPPLAAAGDR